MNSDDVLQEWAERSGEYSPGYYAYYGPNETSELLRARLDSLVGTDAAVLELGCSAGRHLAHLREHGYRDLHGVDVNDDAFDVMGETYPGLHDAGTFHVETIEDAVSSFEDDRFDAVYSVQTLQHVHPDHAWVFDELARIADDLLVTVENEGDANDPDADRSPSDAEVDRAPDGSDADRASDDSDVDRVPGDDADRTPDDPAVNYVDDGLPLYYRDWNRVFTERGFEQVDAQPTDRDTLRAFRPA